MRSGDSNISTFMAGVILFLYGGIIWSGEGIRGHFVRRKVLTGLFSCIVVTRAWYDYLISVRKV